MKRLHWISVLVVAFAGVAAMPAAGADVPIKAPPSPIYGPPPFSWTGVYVGANIGGGWAQDTVTGVITGGTLATNSPGAFAGGG